MNRTNGKIAENSRRRMLEALLEIMKIYDYREITVTQIVQEAGLSRNTFYRLFNDKDEILSMLFDELFNEFYMKIRNENIESFWRVMEIYFNFFENKKPLLMLLQKNHLLQRMLEHSYAGSDKIFNFVHARDSVNRPETLPLHYLLAFSVGGMHNMLIKWVENGMDIPSKEITEKLRSCLMYDGLNL